MLYCQKFAAHDRPSKTPAFRLRCRLMGESRQTPLSVLLKLVPMYLLRDQPCIPPMTLPKPLMTCAPWHATHNAKDHQRCSGSLTSSTGLSPLVAVGYSCVKYSATSLGWRQHWVECDGKSGLGH